MIEVRHIRLLGLKNREVKVQVTLGEGGRLS
jgi:hypothetical protein